MEYTTLGTSDLLVSKICLGCMSFGDAKKGLHTWTLPYEQTKEIIAHALAQGINFFDTAMAYQSGTSEEYLGKAIKALAKREEVVIATKFSPRTQEEIEQHISGQQHVQNCLDESLKRLQMSYVDLYIYHQWDVNTPIEEIMEGLHNVVQQGRARYIGISNCYAWQLAKANYIARLHGWEEFITMQGHYNLIFREEEREMIPFCKEESIALTPYSALASGRLAKHREESSARLSQDNFAKGKYEASKEVDQMIIDRVEELAKQKHVTMSEISLAWLSTKVSSPIIGATKLYHIDDAVRSVHIKLSEKEIHSLEELYKPHSLVGVMAK